MKEIGQTSLPSHFFSKSRVASHSAKPSVSLSEFLNRKVIKDTCKSIKERPSSFSSVGQACKDLGGKTDGVGDSLILNAATFRRFNVSVSAEERGHVMGTGAIKIQETKLDITSKADVSRKRKKLFHDPSSDEHERFTAPKHLVVLGDYPKPKLRTANTTSKRGRPFYDHYANGRGSWDCDKAGVDSEEVGCNETWEGMSSTTLGGLEWH